MLSFDKLQIFCAVVKHQSFTTAAKVLHMSQPSISNHIKSLEDYFGCQLMVRNRREITLTDAGKMIYAFAEETLAKETTLKQSVAKQLTCRNHKVIIGSNRALGSYILSKIMSLHQIMYPQNEITLFIGDSYELIQKINNYEIDIAIVLWDILSNKDPSHIMMTEQLPIISNRDYLASLGSPITRNNLAQQPFILPPSGRPYRTMIDNKLRKSGIIIERPVMELDSMEAIKEAVINGVGIAITFACGVQQDLLTGRLIEVKVPGLTLEASFCSLSLPQLSHDTPANKVLNYLLWQLAPQRQHSANA